MVSCYIDQFTGRTRCYNNAWDNWVRWLVLGLVIAVALFLVFMLSCLSARRRRRMGYSPYRGTAWTLGRTPPGHAPAAYTGNQGQSYGNQQAYPSNNNTYAPPAYAAPPNSGYYGNDVELQQPGATYGGYRKDDNVYQPPKGPPPGRS